MSEAADKLKAEIAKYGKSKRLWYREVYLYSEHWQTLRGAKFSQAGRICDQCKDTERLQIHHLRYRSIYDVKLTDLQVLCVTCHQAEHPDKKPQKAKKVKVPKVKQAKQPKKTAQHDGVPDYRRMLRKAQGKLKTLHNNMRGFNSRTRAHAITKAKAKIAAQEKRIARITERMIAEDKKIAKARALHAELDSKLDHI